MVQQITNGIKIAVKTTYDGVLTRNGFTYHTFSYYISIENKTKDSVQLLSRFWEISDALNKPEFVEGEGVIGQTPIIEPQGFYTYKSHCFLIGATGSMKGYFKMIQVDSFREFNVTIPTFQLSATSVLN